MNLFDLIDKHQYEADVAAGFIRMREHPALPLRILNYTEHAQYAHHWTSATLACRGMIVDEDWNIVARPFPKFFNHDQPEGRAVIGGGRVSVTDKMDGSLGIIYPTGDGYAVATRGSFTSDQAIEATRILRDRYPDFVPGYGHTYLVEIIYPENRIVVDYGDKADLVLLGIVYNESGSITNPNISLNWTGPCAKQFQCKSYAEAMVMSPRPNAEGVVVRFWGTNQLVKIKQADYVALHRIVTGWNERTIWQHLRDGGLISELAESLPDEFQQWAKDVESELNQAHADRYWAALKEFSAIAGSGWAGMARKDFALKASKSPNRAALFLIFDGAWQRCDDWVWDQIKPTSKEAQLV